MSIPTSTTAPTAPTLTARDFMATKLVTLSPDEDALAAVRKLLHYRISGAPVVDSEGNFLGIFSEKTSMRFLLDAAYSQLPSNRVGAFMNTDIARLITVDTDWLSCAQIFLSTPYRRLPVLDGTKLIGQVSRRDLLNAAIQMIDKPDRRSGKFVMYFSALVDLNDSPVD
ncbi:CBS domain-containing protein [Bremerella sp. T1]|uniref:CBS domain-containing protein n=1 Tax=Bremerella sp. TYQ1 TaxID=3119568 RepID=UPI001CCA1614|nr:CBS domain-containing protein [Bremerella volcania]UBM37554.1 CBS domain-containing protein [Bremerella volcania]